MSSLKQRIIAVVTSVVLVVTSMLWLSSSFREWILSAVVIVVAGAALLGASLILVVVTWLMMRDDGSGGEAEGQGGPVTFTSGLRSLRLANPLRTERGLRRHLQKSVMATTLAWTDRKRSVEAPVIEVAMATATMAKLVGPLPSEAILGDLAVRYDKTSKTRGRHSVSRGVRVVIRVDDDMPVGRMTVTAKAVYEPDPYEEYTCWAPATCPPLKDAAGRAISIEDAARRTPQDGMGRPTGVTPGMPAATETAVETEAPSTGLLSKTRDFAKEAAQAAAQSSAEPSAPGAVGASAGLSAPTKRHDPFAPEPVLQDCVSDLRVFAADGSSFTATDFCTVGSAPSVDMWAQGLLPAHLRFVRDGAVWWVRAEDSGRGGVHLNGMPVATAARVTDGDSVRAGAHAFTLSITTARSAVAS